jgi:hypothetical protein
MAQHLGQKHDTPPTGVNAIPASLHRPRTQEDREGHTKKT